MALIINKLLRGAIIIVWLLIFQTCLSGQESFSFSAGYRAGADHTWFGQEFTGLMPTDMISHFDAREMTFALSENGNGVTMKVETVTFEQKGTSKVWRLWGEDFGRVDLKRSENEEVLSWRPVHGSVNYIVYYTNF